MWSPPDPTIEGGKSDCLSIQSSISMATKVLATDSITGKSAAADDDDEISVIHATPFFVNKGTTKFDAVTIEDDYNLRPPPLKRKRVVDSSRDPCSDDIDDVEILCSFPRTQRRFFIGECSNSNPDDDTESISPFTFICGICADENPNDEEFRVSECEHSYCSDCMRKYVASNLKENIISIKCPVSDCTKGSLQPQHCRSILPEQVLDRWGNALREGLIFSSDGFFYTPYNRNWMGRRYWLMAQRRNMGCCC
ncbi:hypothetical protein OROGR_029700 [Orobanche gracilis]